MIAPMYKEYNIECSAFTKYYSQLDIDYEDTLLHLSQLLLLSKFVIPQTIDKTQQLLR